MLKPSILLKKVYPTAYTHALVGTGTRVSSVQTANILFNKLDNKIFIKDTDEVYVLNC
jgi:hypothetical protein